MNKTILSIFIFMALNTLADTGWSGKVTDEAQLERMIQERVASIYDSKCSRATMVESSTPMYIDLQRVDSEFDYLGSAAPRYMVSLSVYSGVSQSFILQEFLTEVTYHSLSREFNVSLIDSSITCIN